MKKGFTLIELVIVLVILGVLATISFVNILRVRIRANEASAIVSLRVLNTGMEGWRSTISDSSYTGAALNTLQNANPPYLDEAIGNGAKQGYSFILTVDNPEQFHATATPITYKISGIRSFIVQEEGVIKTDDKGGDPLNRGEGEAVD